jgi:hypothetical protein
MLVAAGLVAAATGVQAQTPPALGDLVGARGSSGETALQARGYAFVRGEKGDDRSYTFWWNARARQCVTVATMDGRYASITSSPAPDCGKRPDGDRDRHDDDRGRGSGYHPDLGYQPAVPRTGAPSYATPEGGDAGGPQGSLGLVCFGGGQRPTAASSYGYTWDDRRDRYVYGNHTELTAEQFDASVMIRVSPDGGRIRLPRKLIPPINSRGTEGWWDLYDVAMGPEVITARYRLNGLNKPQVTINRRSGQISIVGTASYAFRGDCDLVGAGARRRF